MGAAAALPLLWGWAAPQEFQHQGDLAGMSEYNPLETMVCKRLSDGKDVAFFGACVTPAIAPTSPIKELQAELKSRGFPRCELLLSWHREGDALREVLLLAPGISAADAIALGTAYGLATVVVRDRHGCREVCTTAFEDDAGRAFAAGEVVREFAIGASDLTPTESDALVELFSTRCGSPARVGRCLREVL